jgi:predicted peroxiredoxin
MRTLYMTTAGTSDPTRASISLHLAVNGSLEVGHDVGVVLAGDATELLKTAVRESLEGVGVPPVRDLLAKAHQHNLPIYVWKGCAVAREATDEDLTAIGGQWVTAPDVARLIENADRFVSIWRFDERACLTEAATLMSGRRRASE